MKDKPITFSSHSLAAVPVAVQRKGFTKRWTAILAAAGLAVGLLFVQSCSKAKAGPNGGDLVTLGDGKTNAEIIANSDTGEAMVHTWNQDLKSPQPVEAKPLTLGTEANSLQLDPHPLPSDPAGTCSRFYGRADWLRGGSVHHGWLSSGGGESQRQHFDMNRCWNSGRTHGHMWSEMGGHGPGMGGPGSGMGQGGHGGMRQ